MDGEQQSQRRQSQNPDAAAADVEPPPDQPSLCPEPNLESDGLGSSQSKSSFNQKDIVEALEVVERDSMAIAQSFSSLFASLRLALSEVSWLLVCALTCIIFSAFCLFREKITGTEPKNFLEFLDWRI